MPVNIPGLLVAFQLCIRPRLALPSLVINDIRQLDFSALRQAGYRGAVFDKDNCLTLPHRDTLVPQLTDAWEECKRTFGTGNVLIVSNSAGAHHDAGEIKAESVTHHLQAPVLRHTALKPAYSCIQGIRTYFASLPSAIRAEELVFVGDRVFTDVVMANRMRAQNQSFAWPKRQTAAEINETSESRAPSREDAAEDVPRLGGPLAVFTAGVWQRESTFVRALEKALVWSVERWIVGAGAAQERRRQTDPFLRP